MQARWRILVMALCAAWIPAMAQEVVEVADGRFGYDADLGLLVVAMSGEEVDLQWAGEKEGVEAGQFFPFDELLQTVETGMPYGATDTLGQPVVVYFSNLPLISIRSDAEIMDEPKVPGHFSLWSADQVLLHQGIGIEYRGGHSQSLPKKSFLIEFREDTNYEVTKDVSLLGMRSDDDWNLEAFAIEPLRLRSVVGFDLWRDIHQPYYAFLEPTAQSSVRHVYAELFVDGGYRGLYGVGERVDRKQLQVKKFAGTYRGEIFKGVDWGATTLGSPAPPYMEGEQYWAGFRGIYPKDFPDWESLARFVDFVVLSSESEFSEGIDAAFLRSNAIDYLLLLNMLKAHDNTGKNIFIARYNEHEPYFYVPWDLDGTLGLLWDGTLGVSPNGMIYNGLYDRWMEDVSWQGFRHALCDRWEELRSSLFTVEGIMQRVNGYYNKLLGAGVYGREELAWPDYTYDPGNLAFTETWLTQRLAYLDVKMGSLCSVLGIDGMGERPQMQVYPNPASERVTVEMDRPDAGLMVELYNSTGQLKYAGPFAGRVATINLAGLAPAPYVVRVTKDGMPMAHTTLLVR